MYTHELLTYLFRPAFVKQAVLERGCNGKYASVSKVEGAGHLVSRSFIFSFLFETFYDGAREFLKVPQMQPKRLADAIFTALRGEVVGGLQGEERYLCRL